MVKNQVSHKRIEGLDELRGIAILVVMAHHLAWVLGDYQLGGPAVDLFFIISGFLIGRILILSKDHNRYYRRFYGRRLFRIGPLAVAAIIGCFFLSKILGWNTQSWPYYVFFVQNYIPMQEVSGSHPDWGGPFAGASPLWSLAVEEHFYLIAPFFIRKFRENQLIILCVLVSFLSVYFKNNFILEHGDYSLFSSPRRTETRIVYLLAGLMLNFTRWRYYYLAAVTIVWLGIRAALDVSPGRLDVLGFVFLFLLVDLTIHQRLRFRCQWIAWTGRLCFGLYLIHLPVALVLKNSPFSENPLIVLLIYLPVVYGAAVLSFYFFEEPIRRWGYRRIDRPKNEGTTFSD